MMRVARVSVRMKATFIVMSLVCLVTAMISLSRDAIIRMLNQTVPVVKKDTVVVKPGGTTQIVIKQEVPDVVESKPAQVINHPVIVKSHHHDTNGSKLQTLCHHDSYKDNVVCRR